MLMQLIATSLIAFCLTPSSFAESLDFKLLDQNYNSHHIKPREQPGKILLISVNESLLTKPYQVQTLEKLVGKISSIESPIKTYLIYSGNYKDRQKTKKLVSQFTMLLDTTGVVTRAYRFKHTFDYALLNQTDFSVLASGHLSDAQAHARWPNLKALQQKLESKDLRLTSVKVSAFRSEVLPSLDLACMNCHVRNSRSLDLFNDIETVRNWRAMMLKTIRLALMPGGFDPLSRPLLHEVRSDDLQKIVAWLDDGAQLSKADEPFFKNHYLELRQANDKALKELGPPDLELEFNDDIFIEPNANPTLRLLQFPNRALKGAFIDKVYVVTNSDALHHFKVYASPEPLVQVANRVQPSHIVYGPAQADWNGQKGYAASFNISHQLFATSRITGFVSDYPCYKDVCYRSYVPEGSIFTMEAHYLSTGKLEKDRPKVLIYYAKPGKYRSEPIKKISLMPSPSTFKLKPHQEPTNLRLEYPVKQKTILMGYSLHAHLRARSGKLSVLRAGQKEPELVFSIPFFAYKYQFFKFLTQPLILEPGSRIISEVIYDNTADNEANPNPDATVGMGPDLINQDSCAVSLFVSQPEAK